MSNTAEARTDAEGQRIRALDATLTLVTRAGYRATTFAAVARESGVSESFLLWHFRNKDGLFAEALEYSYHQRRVNAPSWSEVVHPEKRTHALRHNIDGLMPPASSGTEYRTFGLMLGLERRPVEPTARMRFIQFRGRTHTSIAGWWDRCLRIDDETARAAASDLLAKLTLSAIDGRFVNSVGTEFDWALTTDLMVAGLEALAVQLEGDPALATELPCNVAQAVNALPTPAPSAHDETSTRIQILRAAENVAANIGIDAASIARICKQSECSPTSVYWFFKDKNAIFEALIGFLRDDLNVTHPPRPAGVNSEWLQDPFLGMMAHSLWRYSGSANLTRISLMLFLHSEKTHTPIRDECLWVRSEMRREWAENYRHAVPELADADASLIENIAIVHASLCDGLFVSQQIADGDGSMTNYTWVLAQAMAGAIRSRIPTFSALDAPRA